jgi:hypothetical protein
MAGDDACDLSSQGGPDGDVVGSSRMRVDDVPSSRALRDDGKSLACGAFRECAGRRTDDCLDVSEFPQFARKRQQRLLAAAPSGLSIDVGDAERVQNPNVTLVYLVGRGRMVTNRWSRSNMFGEI